MPTTWRDQGKNWWVKKKWYYCDWLILDSVKLLILETCTVYLLGFSFLVVHTAIKFCGNWPLNISVAIGDAPHFVVCLRTHPVNRMPSSWYYLCFSLFSLSTSKPNLRLRLRTCRGRLREQRQQTLLTSGNRWTRQRSNVLLCSGTLYPDLFSHQ